MRVLLDTHTILWAAKGTLPSEAQAIIEDSSNDLYFSPINMWEIELKRNRLNFDPKVLYQNLLHNGYRELKVTTRHVLNISQLPSIHSDPFDRLLLAQAQCEQIYLLTADETIKKYADQVDCIIAFS